MLLPPPPAPSAGASPQDGVAWVSEHLGDLTLEGARGIRPGGHRGGQAAADAALAGLDVAGYAGRRSEVLPRERRGASAMSPWIRHGLLSLREVWERVEDSPPKDRRKYRDELLWQEYARHLYARVGTATGRALRYEQPRPAGGAGAWAWAESWGEPWPERMRCMETVVGELHEDGWLVNQTRMWLASQWAVRAGADWRAGEDQFFTHLLDGSRAANRLGWQWTVATGSAKPYGFSRWQVEKRAPGLCGTCALAEDCPVQGWPDAERGPQVGDGPDLGRGEIPAGPRAVQQDAGTNEGGAALQVWLTAESLGRGDPALAADPDRSAVFVFDEPLLARLRLSGKRLVFLAECLGDLAAERELEVRRGDVVAELAGRRLAATWTPVPGWQRRATALEPTEVHPWPWLARPRNAPVRSFSAWRKALGV